MMQPNAYLSLRGRIFLIVLAGAVLPLFLLSLWFTRTAERSGEALLRSRLEASLDDVTQGVGLRWLRVRGEILRLGDLPDLQAALRQHASDPAASVLFPSPAFERLLSALQRTVTEVRILDADGTERWVGVAGKAPPDGHDPPVSAVPVRLGIFEPVSGQRLGTLAVGLRLTALLTGSDTWAGVGGSVLGVFEPDSRVSLLPGSLDPLLLEQERFHWRDGTWLSVRRRLRDPDLDLVLAAPLAPFVDPFRESAGRNLRMLAAVTVLVLALATLFTRRTTRALGRLAEGAEAVARGDLQREVDAGGRDEVSRVARAFNAMTESLRQTLRELSQRQALSAVGEFAASLAHEVRNPLTSIRLDLQRAEEMVPENGEARQLVARTLERIDRLDRSVSGALQVARSGTVALERIDVRGPLNAAMHAARPAFTSRGAVLEGGLLDSGPAEVDGDPAALERLFLNLLLNAAQALPEGGRATVGVAAGVDDAWITIRDEGPGIDPADIDRIFDPFYSTRPDGTGLGLPIAQRIARAHGGDLSVQTEKGVGTTVTVHLRRHGSRTSERLPAERNGSTHGTE